MTTRIEPTPFARPPKIPSKFDVIPIHASDRGTFKRCRRLWEWSSPLNQNLVPKVEQQGININLWFGTGIHYALAQYYNPVIQRDPIESFKSWWELQWHGGIVDEERADLSYDRSPKQYVHNGTVQYTVQGLRDMLPDPVDQELFEQHLELGIGMLTYYKEYADREDNFAVICEERTFSIPVLDPDGNELIWMDHRPGYEGEKPVHLRGTQDAIIQDLENGQFGIMEHKSAIQVGEEYHRKLEKDEQCTTYMYAAEREARIHGLEYEKISFVIYNALRKAFPRPPTPVRNGLFSINRQTESTTYPLLMEYIRANGLDIIVESDEKLLNYVEYVKNVGDEQFIVRTPVRRNRAEIESVEQRIYMEAMDMLDSPRIYPNPTGDWLCLSCKFRAPCIARDDGSDWKMLLEDGFEENWTR